MTVKTFTAIFHREENMYVAQCPKLVRQPGRQLKKLANLKEATELYLEEFPISEVERPMLTTFEVAINA